MELLLPLEFIKKRRRSLPLSERKQKGQGWFILTRTANANSRLTLAETSSAHATFGGAQISGAQVGRRLVVVTNIFLVRGQQQALLGWGHAS